MDLREESDFDRLLVISLGFDIILHSQRGKEPTTRVTLTLLLKYVLF